MSASATAKEKHYWSQLRAALTAGQWLADFPAKTPQASQLSWSELFRKFNKHCRGFHDVSEVASQTYGLALLLASNSLNEDEDYADVRDFSVELGDESILPPERVEEVSLGYEALKKLQSANSDSIHFALAYYAYALGRPSDCLTHLAQVPDFSQIQTFIPNAGTSRSSTSNLLSVPYGGALSASSSVTGGFSSYVDSAVAEVKDGRGWALTETFRSLCLQGMCHERLEPEDPYKSLRAYRASLPAFKVLQSPEFSSLISPPARLTSGKLDFTSFVQLRELWRWVERLLWRAVSLSSRTSNVHSSEDNPDEEDCLWTWLEKYTICSASWPPTFRTEHRSTVSSIYLRALILRHGIPKEPTPLVVPFNTPIWMQTARSVVQDYRAILNVSTKFPRAGERNVKVEEFADLCVAVWEASGAIGEHASWVIDILWWATRLTFNSSRILRHMTRLLYLSGDTNLAKRSLRLYVQVVSKAWQASKQGAGESVNPDDNDSLANTEHEGYLEDTDTDVHWVETLVLGARMLCKNASLSPGRHDIDDVKEAQTILGRAKERMNSADTSQINHKLRAEVELAEGIADAVLAIKGEDQHARADLFESSHKHLLGSIAIHPTSSAHFHLSLSYARDGPHHDLDQAIQYAGLTVEANPREIRYWHLLGLLLTAAERWEEADTILAHGADIDLFAGSEAATADDSFTNGNEGFTESPAGLSAPGSMSNGDTTTVTPDGKEFTGSLRTRRQSKNFALNMHLNGDNATTGGGSITRTLTSSSTITPSPADHIDHVGHIPTTATVLSPSASFVPPSSFLLRSTLDDSVPPSKHELFEWGLQLRMTQMALVEVQQGAEGAEEGWVEVFGWIAEKRGLGGPAGQTTAATSVDERHNLQPNNPRLSMDIDPRTMSQVSMSALNATMVGSRTGEAFDRIDTLDSVASEGGGGGDVYPNSAPPPIMISPASPDSNSTHDELGSYAEEGSSRNSVSASSGIDRRGGSGRTHRSSLSLEKDKGGDTRKSKKMQQIFKDRVQAGQMKITAVGRKIGHGVTRNGNLGSLRRSSSTPDFHAVLQPMSYQASSIHSRRRISSTIHSEDRTPTNSPTPPPVAAAAPSLAPQSVHSAASSANLNNRNVRENRLISDLWLMSAATFRRLSKVDQAKGAIQEGEARDEKNPNVWVQLALYYSANNHRQHAISTLQKALFIDPDDVVATVHLARIYLAPPTSDTSPSIYNTSPSTTSSAPAQPDIDLACSLLTHLSNGRGWDVPEVWYYLATAYRMQGRAEREGEALERALVLAEGRGVREIGAALGICI